MLCSMHQLLSHDPVQALFDAHPALLLLLLQTCVLLLRWAT